MLGWLSWLSSAIVLLMPSFAWAAGGGGENELGLVSAIGVAVISASVLAVLFHKIKQPALLAYIVAGLALGYFARALFGGQLHTMEHISHLGLVFLLFIIGLEMDLGGILRLGPKAAIAVLLQAPIALAAVYGVQWMAAQTGYQIYGLGPTPESWVYYGVACALGSTAVVVKLLGDKFDLGSQAGRITVLTLIAEDICAVLVLSWVSAQGGGDGNSIAMMLGGGAAIVLGLVLFAKYILSRVMASLALAPDLLALVSIGWCFLCAEALVYVGLSAEMGALIAGLTVGRLPQHVEILAKVASLRDFFMALFFVALGMSLPPPTTDIMLSALALCGIVIVVRLILYAPALLLAGQAPMVSFATPINLAQISEFSLLIVPLGVSIGQLGQTDASIISYGLMLSVVISTYSIQNNYKLAILLDRITGASKRFKEPQEKGSDGDIHHHQADVVFLGFFLNAEAIAIHLKEADPELMKRCLVIDFNLQNHERIKSYGFKVAYGDISNPDTLRHNGVPQAKVIVSTISNAFLRGISNEDLLGQARAINPNAKIITTAVSKLSAESFEAEGAYAGVSPAAEAVPAYVKAITSALETFDEAHKSAAS